MGHTEITTTSRMCRGCGGTLRLIGDDPLLPEQMRKAIHDDGSETGPDGHVAAPLDPSMVSRP
jgi:transposase